MFVSKRIQFKECTLLKRQQNLGGDKSSQQKDIEKAIEIWDKLKN